MAAKQFLTKILGDITFSLSQGLAAQASQPGQRGQRAGMAAAFGGPMLLDQARQKQQQEQQQQEEERQQKMQQFRALAEQRKFDEARALFQMQSGTPTQNISVSAPEATPSPIGGIQGPSSFGGQRSVAAPQHPPIDFGQGRMLSPPSSQGQAQQFIENLRSQERVKQEFAPPSAPAPGFTLSPGQQRFGPDGKSVASVPASTTAENPSTALAVWLKQNPGKPISEWLALNKPAGASPDYEWVTRNGQPLQIPTGSARPGDKPYDAVAARQDGSAAGLSPYTLERAKRTVQSVDELIGRVSGWTTGFGSLLSSIPESAARNFKSEIETLKANIAFSELTAMREASKTGGSLGNVSNIEIGLLQSALGALDTGQSPSNLKSQLTKIKESVERWQKEASKSSSAGGLTLGETKVFQGATYKFDGKQWVKQ